MDTKLRERLEDLANDIPPDPSMPTQIGVRARRRAIANVTSLVVGGVLLVTLAGFGIRTMLRTAERETFGDSSPRLDLGRWAFVPGRITFTDQHLDALALDTKTADIRIVPIDGRWIFAWSHDGTRALLMMSNTLHIATGDGEVHEVRSGLETSSGGSWSPDDRVIVYASPDVSNTSTISVVPSDGTAEPVAIRSESSPFRRLLSPSWSPDGSRIAFLVSDEHLAGARLMVMNADGSGARSLLVDVRLDSWPAVWSPDGSTIAFAGADPARGIYIVRADGTGLTRIVELPGAAPAWSPDGTRLAFRLPPDDELFVVDRDGDHLRPLGVFAFKDTIVLWPGEQDRQS